MRVLDLNLWHDHAWRDPFVFKHPKADQFYAFITARVKDGPGDGRGVIGQACSNDLIHWEVLPPLTESGEFGQMEVPQVSNVNGHYYLLFCVGSAQYSAARKARVGGQLQTGTHYLMADNPIGPYHYLTDQFLSGDTIGSLYSGKLVQDASGKCQFMAFRNFAPDGKFVGEITDPMPVTIQPDGRLNLAGA